MDTIKTNKNTMSLEQFRNLTGYNNIRKGDKCDTPNSYIHDRSCSCCHIVTSVKRDGISFMYPKSNVVSINKG